MINTNLAPRIQEVITKGTNGVIIIPPNASADSVAAATTLYLALTKLNKNISVVCQNEVEFEITAADKIQTQLVSNGDHLVVSFPYSDGSIDKVDYNIQGDKFNLIIAPRTGFPKVDPAQVKFSYTGGLLDFIIVIDSPTLNSLGTIYTDNQAQFQGKDIINIDRHLTNANYGTVNYVNKSASSLSEMVLSLLKDIQMEIDRDMATNLYMGIASATNNFTSYSTNATTFETIASLLRLGAIKKTLKKAVPLVNTPRMPPPFVAPPMGEFADNTKAIEEVEKQPNPEGPPAPQDWLKPKIFRGGGGTV